MREPFQVLVLLYNENVDFKVCIFKRKKFQYWQFLSGGKESEDRSLKDTAVREIKEETGLDIKIDELIELDTTTSIAAEWLKEKLNGNTILVTEKCFAVKCEVLDNLIISDEHSEYKIVSYEDAKALLKWDSNKVALYELYMKKELF